MIKLANRNNMTEIEWLQHRRQGIGGSDISAICGFNKWRNAVSVWLEKTGKTEIEPVENEAMEWGKLLEDLVGKKFSQTTGLKVRNNNFILAHNDYPYMLANIDKEIICPERGKGVLEIKTTSAWNDSEWTSETVPDMYMFQIQWYLMITGYSFGYMAVLIGGQKYKHYLVERDEEIIDYIKAKAVEFWDLVESDSMPEIDGSKASTDALNLLYPPRLVSDEEADLDDSVEAYLEEIKEIDAKADELEERKKHLQNLVKLQMGEKTVGKIGAFTVTWKAETRTTVDNKKLKTNYPSIWEECSKTSESRKFLANKAKGDK